MTAFKALSAEETRAFQEYASTTDPENLERWSIYHPVWRAVWLQRGIGPYRCDSCRIVPVEFEHSYCPGCTTEILSSLEVAAEAVHDELYLKEIERKEADFQYALKAHSVNSLD